MAPTAVEPFATPHTVVERHEDGTTRLRSAVEPEPYAPSVAHMLRAGSAAHPDRVLATHRGRSIGWGEARATADAVAQALLDRGLGPDRPLMILSGNSIEHLLMMLGAYTAGVPVLPTSAAYSLLSADHERIRAIAARCRPGLVFADDAQAFGPALAALGSAAEDFGALAATTPGPAVEEAFARVGPDSVAKILFTSGSTGAPKGVINTHRMLCSNQQALGQIWPFLHSEPPVLVDWLPWSHTFGGNHNLNQVLAYGGTLHIDDGKPAPQLFEKTVEALKATAPTVYYNVPAGYALLAPRLEQDRGLAEHFFSRLRFMFYAAAALPEALWQRLSAVAEEVAGAPVPLTAAWGATETAPASTSAHFRSARCGCIGVPLPGVTLKLVPHGDKQEIRVSGPNVTPGYHDDPAATAAAFDDEGFYRTGDAVRFVDPDDPNQGLMFDGRLAEDFKLTTGTWVHVGKLRTTLLSEADGLLSDAVIAGHDREYAAALAWVSPGEHPQLRERVAQALRRVNAGAGSAGRIERLLLADEPPSLDAGEITDKNYINQRAVLERRTEAVERLYADPPPADVIGGE